MGSNSGENTGSGWGHSTVSDLEKYIGKSLMENFNDKLGFTHDAQYIIDSISDLNKEKHYPLDGKYSLSEALDATPYYRNTHNEFMIDLVYSGTISISVPKSIDFGKHKISGVTERYSGKLERGSVKVLMNEFPVN